MLSVEAVTDLVSRGADLYRHYVPPEWVPYPNLAAATLAVGGILLCFWGARLLKTIYILAFMVVGAAVGFEIGSRQGVDTLIGLTFGAGIAAFVGYLFYRWWVGVTAGTVAVLVVLAAAWPRIQELEQSYHDYRLGTGTDEYRLPEAGGDQQPVLQRVGEFSVYVWTQRREFASRFMFAAGLAWLLGVVLGLLLPKFTTVLGTSLLGVFLVAVGVGLLLRRNYPDTWSIVAGHPDWYLVAMGTLLIVSAWRQVRPGRVRAVEPAPAPPSAPPAPAK